eukprot:CAMPEP_0116848304 /NCGR_PEP_ID=MMETSP0418-20121206/14920_1 /TAXON_ID=1158023 /ORGANISM="Astrosyne radiata, Strain 13vi08-1A" /LENGTH=131 /DNA_ID=CAMNT_0004479855 /DNA_START=52 /DNA_END=447 /DNA_ORIENTATION=-
MGLRTKVAAHAPSLVVGQQDQKEHSHSALSTKAGPPRFTITYCHNCDGGLQEMTAAAECVRQIFPKATILGKRKRSFPILVSVTAHVAPGVDVEIWSGDQRTLFEKYQSKRDESMRIIRENLLEVRRVYGS